MYVFNWMRTLLHESLQKTGALCWCFWSPIHTVPWRLGNSTFMSEFPWNGLNCLCIRSCSRCTMTLTKDRPVLSLERVPHRDKTVTVKLNLIFSKEPQMGHDTKTHWLTVSRNVTLTLTLVSQSTLHTSRHLMWSAHCNSKSPSSNTVSRLRERSPRHSLPSYAYRPTAGSQSPGCWRKEDCRR
jgi:hypothetical protein